MSNELTVSIGKMIVNGKRLELPSDEQFKNYASVKKALILAGGKYSKCGFTFLDDAQKVKDRLVGGEAINDKKKFQFFPTPEKIVDMLVEMADVNESMTVLEPSAGQGAIADKIFSIGAHASMIELMPENVKVLNRKYNLGLFPTDFLSVNPEDHVEYERVIANPPFTKNQDVDHVLHMYKFLSAGGILVSVMSKSWINGSQKKQIAFKKWLGSVDSEVTHVDEGEFKSSGTNIATVIVKITK